MSNINSRETLADSVHQVNYAARWGRVDVAVERVAPSYRTTFLRSRRPWGRDLQIADVELVDIHLEGDDSHAKSVVAVSWYDLRAMDLRTTTLEQAWRRTGQAYVLESEEIVEGDETLVAPPAPEEPASEEDADAS